MVMETVVGWPGWFDWLGMLLLGLIVLFEYIDWNFDRDIELLKENNRNLQSIQKNQESQLKTLEKIEQRLETLVHKK